jgi:hypothetical protein
MPQWSERDNEFSLPDLYQMVLDEFTVDEEWAEVTLKLCNE